MSKFRDTPPALPGDTVIAFPVGGEMTLEQRKAELEAYSSAASEELLLRIRYSRLKDTLDAIDRYEPVPDDWRARLLAREGRGEVALEED